MPINTLGQVAIKMFGKEAPLFVEKVIQAAQSGAAMTATTDEDRKDLTKEAFNQAGVNQDVNSAYTTQQKLIK